MKNLNLLLIQKCILAAILLAQGIVIVAPTIDTFLDINPIEITATDEKESELEKETEKDEKEKHLDDEYNRLFDDSLSSLSCIKSDFGSNYPSVLINIITPPPRLFE